MRHLTPADYRRQPWANGRGFTVELARQDGPEGLIWRLSMATVAEDGPFSIFPGVERVLTVLTGPGFRLTGPDLDLSAAPLVPVAFPGDVAVAAVGVTAASEDFNVMTARTAPPPEVAVVTGRLRLAGAGLLAVFALGPAVVNGRALAPQDLVLLDGPAEVEAAAGALTVRLG